MKSKNQQIVSSISRIIVLLATLTAMRTQILFNKLAKA